MNRRKTGAQMEEMAASFLVQNGVRILARNYRVRQAEIDIVGMDGNALVFIEVKARQGSAGGMASEAVGEAKQKKICRCADHYMLENHIDPWSQQIRFDVVAIGAEEDRREQALAEGVMPGAGSCRTEHSFRSLERVESGAKARPISDRCGTHPLYAHEKTPAQESVLRDPVRHIRWIRGAFPYRRGKPSKPHWRVY